MSQPDAYQTAGSAPTQEERNWAGAAHLGAFVAAYVALGLLAPLIVLLAKGGQSPYVRRHAVESLNFQITILIWIGIGVVLTLVTLGVGLIIIGPVALGVVVFYLVVVILAGVRALNGQDYRYPLTFRFVS